MIWIALLVAFGVGIDVASDLEGVETWAQVEPVTVWKTIIVVVALIFMAIAYFKGEDFE